MSVKVNNLIIGSSVFCATLDSMNVQIYTCVYTHTNSYTHDHDVIYPIIQVYNNFNFNLQPSTNSFYKLFQ